MKRSTFIATARQRFVGPVTTSPESLAALAEEAGVQWDPEEPELPERIGKKDEELAVYGADADREWDWEAITREAAARYNAVGRFWSDYGAENSALMRRFRDLVREERERLT